MKFSKSWLQDYIVEALPSDDVIVDVLNKKSFEVEETISIEDDTVYEIKVLPNRAHDALGHVGMARELCADFGLTFKEDKRVRADDSLTDSGIAQVLVETDDAKACTRFMSMRVDGVKAGESPSWLKERLESIGQRSINNIVDITNYVQFTLNKPMHAYDARSITGTLRARFAKSGETLATLDEKELTLDEKTLVIADDEKVLGLAGIKGGKYSGIKNDTTSVILESANFNSTLIRKTGEKYGYKTDASKRFENGIANSLVEEGLYMTANLIKEICSDAKIGVATDVYPKKEKAYRIGFSVNEVNDILGTSYTKEEVLDVMKRQSFNTILISKPREIILEKMNEVLGKPYKRGASVQHEAPDMFDCSALSRWLFIEVGYSGVPRICIDQYVYGEVIEEKDLSLGDLIFVNTGVVLDRKGDIFSKILGVNVKESSVRDTTVEFMRGTKVDEAVDHVGIYAGDGDVVHVGSQTEKVIKEKLATSSYFKNKLHYRRIISDDTERLLVTIPFERMDLYTKEDITEEIGRIIGYEKITPTLPKLNRVGLTHKRMFYENKIREILVRAGFSEVMTYTFGDEGDVEIVKGLADDKEKLRSKLSDGLLRSMSLNLHNAPLLGQDTIKLFELGNVFGEDCEVRHLGIAIDDGGKKSNFTEEVDLILSEIKRTLDIKDFEYETASVKPYVIELDFDTMISSLPEPANYEAPTFSSLPVVSYKTVSPYPFIARDIAMWVPAGTTWESIYNLCTEVRNPLITRIDLFDTFSKENKTSFAFRLVFQSYEKTLTDEEVNKMMEGYYEVFKSKGYEIR